MAAKEETGSLSKEETEHFANIEVLVKKFEDAMEDDFNTADAVSAIFEIVRLKPVNLVRWGTKQQ